MKYRLAISVQADQELDASYLWWASNRSVAQAARWYREFLSALVNLRIAPRRHGIAREPSSLGEELRELYFGVGRRLTHCAVFAIRDDVVHILSVRHVARDFIPPGEI